MTLHSALNGQVTFDCFPAGLKTLVVKEALEAAVPEAALFAPGSDSANIFSHLVDFLGQTRGIEFNIDLDEDAVGLQAFWLLTQDTTNYRRIWEAFLLLSISVHNEWLEATASTIDPRLLAPPEVQAGLPETTDDPVKKKKSKAGSNASIASPAG